MPTSPATAAQLQERARRLRERADSSHPLLAQTYRRRAAELDIEALLEAVWNPPIDVSDLGDLGDARAPADPAATATTAPARPRHLAVA